MRAEIAKLRRRDPESLALLQEASLTGTPRYAASTS